MERLGMAKILEPKEENFIVEEKINSYVTFKLDLLKSEIIFDDCTSEAYQFNN